MKKLLVLLPTILLAANLHAATTPDAQLQSREQRVKLLESEIAAIDDRIEARVDLIVEKLTGLVDSKESRSQISQLKKQTMTSLEDTIQTCQRRRAAIVEEMRNPRMNLTLEQKQKITAIFDDRVEKRIDQILALQKSFPAADETGKYNTGNTRYSTPYFAGKAQQSQDRRLALQSDSLRSKVTAALKEGIERLQAQNRSLTAKLATVTDATHRDLISQEIKRNETLIAARQKQLTQTFEGAATNARAVTRNEAADLNKLLADADKDLRADVNSLSQRYSEYLPALADLNTTRAAAQAQKQ